MDDAVSYSPKKCKSASQETKHSSTCKTHLNGWWNNKAVGTQLESQQGHQFWQGQQQDQGLFVMLWELIHFL